MSLKSERDYIIVASTSQSNEGRYSGSDTPVDNRVIAWNATADNVGNAFVTGELGNAPCRSEGWNNQFLQCCRRLAELTGKRIYWVGISKGGLAIENWLENPPDFDMFTRLDTEVQAMISAANLPPDSKVDLFLFDGNESNDSYAYSYADLEDLLIQRLRTTSWFGDNTIYIRSLIAENYGSGLVNIELIDRADKYANFYGVVETRDEYAEDEVHWSGASLTSIGCKKAEMYLAMQNGKVCNVDKYLTRDFDPEFLSVTCNYTKKEGHFTLTKPFIWVDFDIEFDSLDITGDASAIQILVPKIFNNVNCDFMIGQINPYLCTGLNLSANDAVYFQNQGANNKIRLVNSTGAGITYNSGKINASGRIAGSLMYRYV